MPKFTSKTQTKETAIFASSDGEGMHADTTSLDVAAIVGIQLNVNLASTGAGIYGESRGGGAGIAGFQVNLASRGAGVFGESRGGGAGVVGFNLVQPDPGPSGNR